MKPCILEAGKRHDKVIDSQGLHRPVGLSLTAVVKVLWKYKHLAQDLWFESPNWGIM
jgi:hypothetical protein